MYNVEVSKSQLHPTLYTYLKNNIAHYGILYVN